MEPTYHLTGLLQGDEGAEDFEGPLTLILLLLQKNKIAIRDLQISLILEQYTDYLKSMEALDLEIAGEFIRMASYLLFIKTKMLLTPRGEEISELEALIESLENLKATGNFETVKLLIPQFSEWSNNGVGIYTKSPEERSGTPNYDYRHEPYELLSALKNIFLRNIPEDPQDIPSKKRRLVPVRVVYPVVDKSIEIIDFLSSYGSCGLNGLYGSCKSKSELVACFLSVLDLCRNGKTLVLKEGENYVLALCNEQNPN